MKPVEQPQSFNLTGDGVEPLPVVEAFANADGKRGPSVLISRWRMTRRERLRALLRGDIWLTVIGTAHPPVQLATDSPFLLPPQTVRQLAHDWLRRRGVWLWSQNLNEHRSGGVKGSGLRHGRAWLSFHRSNERAGPQFHVEWVLGKLRFGWSLELEPHGDDDVLVHGAVPGVDLYVGASRMLPTHWLPLRARETRLAIHNGSLWWSVWADPHERRSTDPKWRSGSFDPVRALLGRTSYSRRVLGSHRAEIPMPEGVYPATVELVEDSWTRSRWPWPKRLLRAEITPDKPVPAPGKGENSYDLDEDATYSMTTAAASVSEAVGNFVASVLSDRGRHGGPNWRPQEKVSA